MCRTMVMTLCLISALLVSGVPRQGFAEAAANGDNKAAEQKKEVEQEKDTGGDLREGVNRAYDGFKKETVKGKKNLNDLYEREKARSGK